MNPTNNHNDRLHEPIINLRIRFIPISAFLLLVLFVSCIEEKVEPLMLGSIQGSVISKLTEVPLEDVEITTAPVTSVVFTDASGNFTIGNIPEGEYTIITKADNYTRESVKVSVLRNSTTEITIRLSNSVFLAPPPLTPLPENGAIDQPLSVQLQWSVDSLYDDSLRYTVNVYEANHVAPLIKMENLSDTTLLVENLKYNTAYYWQVDVTSRSGNLTAGDLWSFKTAPFPANRLVFTSARDGNYEIYSSDAAGASLVRITNTSSYERRPFFSNDRQTIAFSSIAGVEYQIYTMKYDGTELRKVTTLPIAGYHNQGVGFSWSPDNGKFIYSHYEKLYRIDKDGVNLTTLATAPAGRTFRSCHWTATGNKIVVEAVSSTIYTSEIYLMNADGSGLDTLVTDLAGIMESPSFTIDGKEVIFTRDASGYESDDGRQLDAHIYIINIETLEIRDLSANKPNGTNDLQPRMSPDGSKIIFMNCSNDGTGNRSIWIMEADGSNRTLIHDNAEMPHWQ